MARIFGEFGISIGTSFHGHASGHSSHGGGPGLYVNPVYGGPSGGYPYAQDPYFYDSVNYNPHNEFASMTYRGGRR